MNADELGDVLAGDDDLPDIADGHAWSSYVVVDDAHASRLAYRIRKHRAEIARCEALADEQLERIRAWLDDATSGERGRIARLEERLAAYAARLAADDDRFTSRKFPGGEVGRRKQPDMIDVHDPVAFVEWAIKHRRDAVKIEPRVSVIKAAIDSAEGGALAAPHIDRDKRGKPTRYGQRSSIIADDGSGEVVPGVSYVVGDRKFYGKATP